MTDRDLMVEHIQAALQAVEQAHAAGEELKNGADAEKLDAFRAKMLALEEHLKLMKTILAHEGTYVMDELAASLAKTLGEREGYHRIPHYDVEKRG